MRLIKYRFYVFVRGVRMRKLVIISTVGASLITNYAKYVKADPWRFLDSIDMMSQEEIEELKVEILNYLRSLGDNFLKASAELNSIIGILQMADLSRFDEIELMFIISDTKQGCLIAEVLTEFFMKQLNEFNGKKLKVYYDVVSGLSYVDAEHATRGLPTLAAKIAMWIKNKRAMGHEVIVNVTGGFKAESIYAALISLIAETPTYYMHEKFKKAIRLPPIASEIVSKEEREIILEIIKKFYDDLKKVR